MAINITVPNIGHDELEITEILVKAGDKIDINQPLFIMEGDKSTIEIPSTHSGIIDQLYIKIGDKVHTGSLILSLNTKCHSTIIQKSSIDEKTIIQQQNNAELHNNYTKNHNTANHNLKYHKKEPDYNYNNPSYIYSTPLIRHMARKLKINLSKIKGSGRKGRIIKEDIYQYLSKKTEIIPYDQKPIDTYSQTSSIIKSESESNHDNFGPTLTKKLNKIKKISGHHLYKSWSTIPHVTQFDIVDVTTLEKFRKQQNKNFEKKNMNYKLTMLVFIIKAVAKALKELPHFNSSLSVDNEHLILKKYINIGIAVDTQKGLLVPVLRNVDKKGIIILSQELLEIAQKAKSGDKLTPFDMQGGTFTISNLGGIGGTAFTPIIKHPEVAILGVSKSSIHPKWIKNKFVPRLMLPLSLSYDHRVIDGADGARFINLINTIISDIRLLSM